MYKQNNNFGKKSQKIYSIYNYIQKHNSKEKNIRQMHPHSFAASLLLILFFFFKNTSQIMRAKIPIKQKTMFGRSQPSSPFSQFPFTLNSKALNLSFSSIMLQMSRSTDRALPPMRNQKYLPSCFCQLLEDGYEVSIQDE